MRRIWRRLRQGIAVAIAAAIAVAVVAGLVVVVVTRGSPTMTIAARFATAPGLFPGNQVKILGMRVGKVVSVKPKATYVTVTMVIPTSTKVPADAQAFIMAPNIISDRFVQLNPPYTGGARMADHGTIPLSRTGVPVSVDEVIDSLDQFALALGPSGANQHGALSNLLHSAATAFGSNGSALHSTLINLGQAFGALSSQGPDLTSLFNNLGNLSHVASQYTGLYQNFANDLAVVSTALASDNQDLGSALANLQQFLGQLDAFIHNNAGALGSSVRNLSTFAGAVAKDQAQVEQVWGVLPVALQNLDQAIDPTTGALRARLDEVSNSNDFAQSVCGDPFLHLLPLAFDPQQDSKDASLDLGCGLQGLLEALPNPPGASTGPNMSLSAILGRQP
jgi:phospholipid/cholesterol/gamma-HCH transport system substrate-binding protein